MGWRSKEHLIWLIAGIFFFCGVPAWAAKEAAQNEKGAVEKTAKESKPEVQSIVIDPTVIRAIESLSAKDPSIALRTYYLAAEGYQNQNQLDQAITVYESALTTFPKQEDEILNRLMNLYQSQGKFDKVIEAATALSKLHPDNLSYQQTIANANFSKGSKDAGLAVWKTLINAHADDANLHLQYAQVLQGQGKIDEAIGQFKSAAALRPQEANFAQQLAQAYINAKRFDEAKQVYESLMASSKDSWAQRDAGRQLLNIAMQQKTLDALLSSLESAVAKRSGDLNLHWQLIEGYSMEGKNDKVLVALERAAKQIPDDRDIASRLIGMYQMDSKWDKSIDLLKGQIKKYPNESGLRSQLAQAYAGSGNIKEAVIVLEETAKLDPNNSFMYGEQIADIYARANKLDDAIKAYEGLKAKATEDWRKTNYASRIDQLKQQKESQAATKPVVAETSKTKP